MTQYELIVGRGSRLLIGVIISGISALGLFLYGLENKNFLLLLYVGFPFLVHFKSRQFFSS